MLDGVIPPAWRDYWDSVEYLRSKSGMDRVFCNPDLPNP